MNQSLGDYEPIVGHAVVRQLRTLGDKFKGLRVVHVNSTSEGGGVAEILTWMVPLMRELGIEAEWKVIRGTPAFFSVTKAIHNGLQGKPVNLSRKDWETYYTVNAENYRELGDSLAKAEIVVIHDPQPAPLLGLCPNRKGKWIWRAHIDISRPSRLVWKTLRGIVERADATIFSMAQFA